MSSRIRDRKTFKRLFECFVTFRPPASADPSAVNGHSNGDSSSGHPVIESIYPPSYNNQEILKNAIQFACPCPSQSGTVELFTFVLTSGDSKWTFGYCRHPPAPTASPAANIDPSFSSPPSATSSSLFLTFLPWQEIFYRTLNYCAELQGGMAHFLQQMYNTAIPEAGTCLYIATNISSKKPFICACPTDYSLPSIPENRNVSEFYNALSTDSMLTLFEALLAERRIVVTSKKLSRLSSIVITCNLFLFPMFWQHIFIPILPTSLQDYLAAPMPFLIGVPQAVWDAIPSEMIGGQVVRVDADTNTVSSPFIEEDGLPEDIAHPLRKNLTGERVLGDGLARAFLRALAQLMGHYQDAIPEDTQRFDSDLFVRLAHPSHRAYIQDKLLKLQIFQQFTEERVERIKNGNVETDEFELESLAWRSYYRGSSRNGIRTIAGQQNKALKKAGKAMFTSVRKEGNHFIDTVKHNSALKSAFRSVKEGGKTVKQKGHVAYSDIKSKFHVPIPSSSVLNFPSSSSKIASLEYGQKSTYRSATTTGRSAEIEKAELNNSLNLPKQLQESHIMSSSCSASNLPSSFQTATSPAGNVRVMPRLSKSEENLIDLDTPDGISLGFTLENPLYELVNHSNNSVFEDVTKTDDQLLSEYGLNEYFSQLNVSSNASFSSQGSAGSSKSASASAGGGVTDTKQTKVTTVGVSAVPSLRPPSTTLPQLKIDLNSNSRNSNRNSKQWTTFE